MENQGPTGGQPPGNTTLGISSTQIEQEHLSMINALVEGELEQLKTRLFSALAHELRTPLASLRLAAGLLVSAPPAGSTEDHRQLFHMLLQSSDRLDLLITSLLDYARLESRHLQLNMQTVDLRLILEAAAGMMEPHYRAKRQVFDLHLPDEPVNVRGDPFRLKSAVQALLDTACKRCPENGRISMGCRAQEGDMLGWICDTGSYIPEEAHEQIFSHAYWQTAEDPPSLMMFGLGLPFAHGMMTLHGGSLHLAAAEAGKEGMCLYFHLPSAVG